MQRDRTNSKELFERFDKDHNGGISKEEWTDFWGKQIEGLPSWEELDVDNNGMIDLHEFEAILPKIQENISKAESGIGSIAIAPVRRQSTGLEEYLINIHHQLNRNDSMSSLKSIEESPIRRANTVTTRELHSESIMKKFVADIGKVIDGDEQKKSQVRKELTTLGLDDHLPRDVPIFYKSYRLIQMSFLHFAVKWSKSLTNNVAPLQFLLEHECDVHAEAVYLGFGGVRCKVQPIHLAAASGSIEALELLLKYGATIDARVDHNGPHSTPLLDAAFLNEEDIILYLIKKKADLTLSDKKTMQALHIVAQQGSDPELLKKVVPAMVRGGAELGTAVKDTEDNRKHNKQLIGKTPLQIAADLQSSAAFPKAMLYLLAQSSWDSESDASSSEAKREGEADLFEEVLMMATVNRNAASQFTQSIKNQTNPNHGTALRNLRKAALERSDDSIRQLSQILILAPLAGADILDMLVDYPVVEVKQQHPLPTCVDLGWGWFKVPMRCAYQDDVLNGKPAWRFDNRGAKEWPKWHDEVFKQEQVGRDSVYNVQTRVLWLPNALNIELFTALSGTTWNIEVFGYLAIQGMIACVWDKLVWTVYCRRMMSEMMMILILLGWNSRFFSSVMWILLLAFLGFEVISHIGVRSVKLKLPTASPISKMETMATLVLIPLVLIRPETGFDWVETEFFDRVCDMLLSFNVAFRFLKLVYGLRAFQETGRSILSIQQSLIARNVRQMLVVAFLFFTGSLLTFLTVRGTERLSQVVLAVFRVLILTDQEGLSTLTSLMGGDAHGVYTGVLSYVITPVYTICLLTLVTAVYSNEYEKIDPRSSLLFEKSRARICTQFMLTIHGLNSILPRKPPLPIKGVGAVLALSCGLLLLKKDENLVTLVAGMITASCLLYMNLYWYFHLMKTQWDLAGVTSNGICEAEGASAQTNRRFLWICHREDFDPTNWRDNESAKEKQIEEIQERLDELSQDTQTTKSQMDKIELVMKQVIENQEKILRVCDKINIVTP